MLAKWYFFTIMHKDQGTLNVRGIWKSLREIQEKTTVSLVHAFLSYRDECRHTWKLDQYFCILIWVANCDKGPLLLPFMKRILCFWCESRYFFFVKREGSSDVLKTPWSFFISIINFTQNDFGRSQNLYLHNNKFTLPYCATIFVVFHPPVAMNLVIECNTLF